MRRPLIRFSPRLTASSPLLTIPDRLSLGDVLQRLALVAPEDVRALERMARAQLRLRWQEGRWSA